MSRLALAILRLGQDAHFLGGANGSGAEAEFRRLLGGRIRSDPPSGGRFGGTPQAVVGAVSVQNGPL